MKYFITFIALSSVLCAAPVIPGTERLKESSLSKSITLVTELACTNCHQSDKPYLQAKKGPDLNYIVNRVRPSWVREYLKQPQIVSPGTSMPNFFHGKVNDKNEIEALIHYLYQPKKEKLRKIPRLNQASRGKVHYNKYGCIACHGEYPRKHPDKTLRPLASLEKKYSFASLTRFLMDPLKVRPAGRMPHLNLNDEEASEIAAFLVHRKEMEYRHNPREIKQFKSNAKLAKQGKELFINKGCVQCHSKDGLKPKKFAKQFDNLNFNKKSSCIQGADNPVRYNLSEEQSKIIETLAIPNKLNKKVNLEVHLAQYNCYACHKRDGLGGPMQSTAPHFHGNEGLGDEGKLPPPLDNVENKLSKAWLDKVLSGKGQQRKYLDTRMPYFGPEAKKKLTHAFHQHYSDKPNSIGLDKGDVEAGRKLVGAQGMNCIMCHDFKNKKSLGIPALNIAGSPHRLQENWFKENLIHPTKLRPGTLMPSFWPNGESTNKGILGGDTDKQIAAIWAYLKNPNKDPSGYPPPRKEFELKPEDKPIVFRTFMETVGHSSIAVGDPSQLHYALNGYTAQIKTIWKGRFLDSFGTQINRFAPYEKPLGTNVLHFPNSAIFSLTKNPNKSKLTFKGYTINKQGYPSFQYQCGDVTIEDSLKPLEDKSGFLRKLTFKGNSSIWFHKPSIKGGRIKLKDKTLDTKSIFEINPKTLPYLEMTIQW